jgi:hypothetical protein
MIPFAMFKFLYSALFIGQVDALIETANRAGTLGMQAFVILLLLILCGVVKYQNNESKAATKAAEEKAEHRAAKEDEKFMAFVDHHNALVSKLDQQRLSFDTERNQKFG